MLWVIMHDNDDVVDASDDCGDGGGDSVLTIVPSILTLLVHRSELQPHRHAFMIAPPTSLQ